LEEGIHEGNTAHTKTGEKPSFPIASTKGLMQGCSLSTILFNIYDESSWKKRSEVVMGCNY
jgi:hypothetical protein